jgi:hypothetical protein
MKDNGSILKTMDVFMTKDDMHEFSIIIKKEFNNVSFVSYQPEKEKTRKEYDIIDSSDIHICIVNNSIISLDEYNSFIIENNDYFYFPQIGKGMIQFDLSMISEYHNKCLNNGRVAVSYREEDKETNMFVKDIFKIIKSKGKHVYRINEKSVFEKPERNAYAWPNAVKQFDGSDEKFLSFGYKIFAIAK